MSSIEKIDNIDFSWIEKMLVLKNGYNKNKAKRCVFLYRCVLKIAVMHPSTMIAPPSGADAAMHLHVLHTKRYANDCESIFGNYVHHDPEITGTLEFWTAWNFTVRKLSEYFGISLEGTSEFQDELHPEYCALIPRAS